MAYISFSWQHAVVKSDLESTTKHLLLTINVHLNPKGEGAFPSYGTLAKEMGLHRSTVIKHMNIAVEAGFLIKEKQTRQDGGNKSNIYRANPDVIGGCLERPPQSRKTTPLVVQDDPPSRVGTTPITNQYNKPIEHIPPISPQGEVLDIPHFIDGDVWLDFVKHRGGKKFTKLAAVRIIAKLTEWHSEGVDANEVLNNSIMNNWKGVFKPNGAKNGQQRTEKLKQDLLEWVDE